jgi:hypothetical protein
LLAQIYSARAYEDTAQVSQHMSRFAELCPASVRALPALRWSKDKALVGREAARLRKNIAARTDSEAVAAYPTLWSLEEALQRSDQQAENQARMRQDLQRLSGAEFVRNLAWLSTHQATWHFEGVPDGAGRKAQSEVAALYPSSAAAMNEEYAKVFAVDRDNTLAVVNRLPRSCAGTACGAPAHELCNRWLTPRTGWRWTLPQRPQGPGMVCSSGRPTGSGRRSRSPPDRSGFALLAERGGPWTTSPVVLAGLARRTGRRTT